jgi:hypothetical protein
MKHRLAIGNKELARIHTMKKEADITDEDYRVLLSGAAGVDSAKDIKSQAQYKRVIKALLNLRVAQGKNILFEKAVYAKAKCTLGSDWRTRLSGYLKRLNKTTLADCNDRELRQIMGFLSKVAGPGCNYGKG